MLLFVEALKDMAGYDEYPCSYAQLISEKMLELLIYFKLTQPYFKNIGHGFVFHSCFLLWKSWLEMNSKGYVHNQGTWSVQETSTTFVQNSLQCMAWWQFTPLASGK